MLFEITAYTAYTMAYENFMIIKFYGLLLKLLDKKLTDLILWSVLQLSLKLSSM